jgi:hypothetical protein
LARSLYWIRSWTGFYSQLRLLPNLQLFFPPPCSLPLPIILCFWLIFLARSLCWIRFCTRFSFSSSSSSPHPHSHPNLHLWFFPLLVLFPFPSSFVLGQYFWPDLCIGSDLGQDFAYKNEWDIASIHSYSFLKSKSNKKIFNIKHFLNLTKSFPSLVLSLIKNYYKIRDFGNSSWKMVCNSRFWPNNRKKTWK